MRVSILFLIAWSWLAAAAESTHPLAFTSDGFCTTRGGVIALPETITIQPPPAAGQPSLIVLDDGAADYIRFQTDRGGRTAPLPDEACAGGTCIDFVTDAGWTFQVSQGGTYTRWTRLYLPAEGTWNHWEQIDDAEQTSCYMNTRAADPLKEWYWYKSPHQYELPAGVHTYSIAFFLNGKRCDRIVFASDPSWTPEGLGPELTPRPAPPAGAAVSERLYPEAGRTLTGLTFEMAAGTREQVAIGWRIGDGAWQPYTAMPPASALAGAREQGLQFRFALTRAADGIAPAVKDVRLSFAEDPQAFFTLPADDGRLRFGAGGLAGGFLADGTQLVAPLQPQRLVDIALGDHPDRIRWLGEELRLTACIPIAAESAQLDWSALDGKLRVRVLIVPEESVYRWQLSVSNDSAEDVLAVKFPIVQGVRLGESHADDELAFPYVEPQLIRNPAGASSKSEVYPRACMNWLSVADGGAGLFLSGLESNLLMTRLDVTPARSHDRVTVSLTKEHRIAAGTTASYTHHLALYAGDWHPAADLYRRIFDGFFPRPDYPEWLRTSQGWYAPYLASVSRNAPQRQPAPYTAMRDKAILRAWALGTRHVEMWGQASMDHACPNYYLPDAERGGEAGFLELIGEMKRDGLRIGSYFNPNSISTYYCVAPVIRGTPVGEIPEPLRPPSLDWYNRHRHYPRPDLEPVPGFTAEELAAIAEHRQVVPRLYGQMCWQSDEWLDFVARWMVKYIGDYRHDMIYHDTLGTDPKHTEWNPHLGLKGEGSTGRRMYDFLARMHREGRAINPDFFQSMEATTDALAIYAIPLMSGRDVFKPLYRYTFPDQIAVFGQANGWWNPPQSLQCIQIAFLEGLRFDILRGDDVADIVWLREALGPWFYDATYRHDVGLASSDPTIQARVFTLGREELDGLFVSVYNTGRETPLTLTVDADRYGDFSRALVMYRDGRYEWLAVADRAFTMAAPKRDIAAVLLSRRATGRAGVLPWLRATPDGLALTVINLGEGPVQLAGTLSSPVAGWQAPGVVIPPVTGAVEVAIPIEVAKGQALPVQLDLAVGGQPFASLRRCLGTVP